MTFNANLRFAPFAFGAMVAFVAVLSGCTKDEPPRPAEGQLGGTNAVSRMEDPVYREAIGEKIAEKTKLLGVVTELRGRLAARENAVRESLGADADDAARAAAVARDEECASLARRIAEATKAMEDNRRASIALVRSKLVPEAKKTTSE